MRVRVSVANLVRAVTDSLDDIYIGILSSGAYKKGQLRLQPIGGAATLTEEGKKYLEDNFGAEAFHKAAEGGIDARFEIDDKHLPAVFDFFKNRDPKYFETDPTREILEELSTVELVGSGGLPELPAILTPEEAGSIQVSYVKTVEQPFKDEGGTSTLEKAGVPSRRLFHQFDLDVPDSIFRKMITSKAVRVLEYDEMMSTKGGSQKGATRDGVELADNFIP